MHKLQIRQALYLLFLVLTQISCSGQNTQLVGTSAPPPPQQSAALHGTVNILLANKQGLVAVTDSRLSIGGVTAGTGQKLFSIDDHTICAIAGWFSAGGPTMDSIHYPAYAAIPNVINFYAAQTKGQSLSLERRFFTLSRVLTDTLDQVELIQNASGRKGNFTSQLTMASSENGRIRIMQGRLIRDPNTDHVEYLTQDVKSWIVDDQLIFVTAGLDDVAQRMLAKPTEIATQGSAIFNYYREAITSGKGSTLTTEDMVQVARYVEKETSERYKGEVGGPTQVAVIAGSAVNLQEPYDIPDPNKEILPNWISVLIEPEFSSGVYGAVVPSPRLVLISKGKISNTRQQLDNIIFLNTQFVNCSLSYDGSPEFLLDATDTIIGSTLTVGQKVDLNSPFIQQIRTLFPTLSIKRGDASIPPS